MPVHGADDREKNMETGLAVLFGVCCSVTDCKRRKITLSVLLAGAAAGCILSGIRIWQGTESAWEMFAAILPAVCLESVVILTAGKVGSGDAGMLLVFGLAAGVKACVSILCMGCLLIGVQLAAEWGSVCFIRTVGAVCPVFICCDGDYAVVADVKMRKLWKKTNIRKKKKQTVMWS